MIDWKAKTDTVLAFFSVVAISQIFPLIVVKCK
jgi:hypothetical protein